jgi:hypothetical protein
MSRASDSLSVTARGDDEEDDDEDGSAVGL